MSLKPSQLDLDATGTGLGICHWDNSSGHWKRCLGSLEGAGAGWELPGCAWGCVRVCAWGCVRVCARVCARDGRAPGDAGAELGSGGLEHQLPKFAHRRSELSAACQDAPGTLLSSCFPNFKHHGLFLLYFSTFFCAEKLTAPLCPPS